MWLVKTRIHARVVRLLRRRHLVDCGRHLGRFSGFLVSRFFLQLDMTGGFGGRKLFVGGLPPKVDENALRDVFSRFWHIEEGL